MNIFELIAVIIAISAGFAYINHRFLKMPDTIGLMVLALASSIILIVINFFDADLLHSTKESVRNIDFSNLLLNGMLSFMLFAGAFHTDYNLIKTERISVLVFALIGVLLCTFLVGSLLFYTLSWFNLPANYLVCLLFGALISPTDPIAVLGILAKFDVPERIKVNIVGESLFNDGVGVVIFATLLNIFSQGYASVSTFDIAKLFIQEAIGGIFFGIVLGYIIFKLLKSIDHYQTEVLITLAAVAGGYMFAQKLHISGPLAMVVAGLFVGNRARGVAMSDITEEYVDKFWEMLDGILNAILFVLIGFFVLSLEFKPYFIGIGFLTIIIVLLSRYISVILPFWITKRWTKLGNDAPILLTWGGLRGGLSIAMALSLPNGINEKSLIIFITYLVVLFSIIVQGLSLEKLIKRLYQ